MKLRLLLLGLTAADKFFTETQNAIMFLNLFVIQRASSTNIKLHLVITRFNQQYQIMMERLIPFILNPNTLEIARIQSFDEKREISWIQLIKYQWHYEMIWSSVKRLFVKVRDPRTRTKNNSKTSHRIRISSEPTQIRKSRIVSNQPLDPWSKSDVSPNSLPKDAFYYLKSG